MRVLFFLNFISLAPDNWSIVFAPEVLLAPREGVAVAFYAAFSLLCVFAIRFPLKFTPLLLIQFFYKLAWLIGVYLPVHQANAVDERMESWFWVMAPGIVIDLLVIPWVYVFREYLSGFFRLR